MPELFGYEVTEDAAIDLVRHVVDGPIRFLDTSNVYGGGRSEAAEAMNEVCRRWDTDLAAAALQFSLRDPRIASTVTGFTKQSTLERTLEAVDENLPESFWAEIEALVPQPEHWLDNNPPIVW
jgi:aryl-alcohol dehydrogenase-like predicted oxidoreductase